MNTLVQPKGAVEVETVEAGEKEAWEDGDITNTETGAHVGTVDAEQDFLEFLFQGISIFHNGYWYAMKVDQRYKSAEENDATAAG